MKRTLGSILLAMALTVALAGCPMSQRKPEIKAASISPSELQPGGGTALITVEVSDYFGIIHVIKGTLTEDPRITFQLHDDGVSGGDPIANDGIWNLRVVAPLLSPPGDYHVELTAYDEKNNPIIVSDKSGANTPLTVTLTVTIRYPQN